MKTTHSGLLENNFLSLGKVKCEVGRGNFDGKKALIVKYRDTLWSSYAKMAEPIEMLFALWVRMGCRNHVLDGGPEVLRELWG